MAIQGFFTGDVKIRELNGVLKAVNGIVEVATDAGTVTSVGLTVGSTGTDVNVANSPITTSGSITLNLPTASATNRGLLSSADWTTFNSKQSALTFSAPLVNTSGTISIPAATSSVNGYLTSTDWSTFNSKQGTITLTTTGSSGAATLVGVTLNIPNYGSALTGYVPYTGATGAVNLGAFDLTVQTLTIGKGNSSLANNTALGYRTLFHITTGNYNTAVGYEAAHNTTTGQYNTALGQSALFTNTTGSQNTAIGLNALLLNTTGGSNVVVGLDALQHNTTGSSNTALGYNAGSHITGGSTPNTTASSSVYIGRDTKAKVDGGSNEIVIGYNAIGNGSNTATFGNTSTTANYFTGSINGGSFVKSGGTSSQFLKADGSVDSSTYYLASNPSAFIALTALSATAPLSYSNTTGVFSISQATTSTDGYLSSTDWNTFYNKQAAGSYITALTGEATATGPGSATVTLSTSAVTGKLLTGLNLTGGGSIAATDSILQAFGKVQNQISGLAGGVTYQGVWNASTNTPTLTSSVGTKGYYYIVDVAGSTNLNGITDWKIGDWAIFNGSTWDKVDNTDAVSSVNGFTGAVSLTTSNIAEGTNLYYLDSRARLALSFTAGSGAYDNTTGVITIPTNTSQLTNGANFISLSSLSASSPLAYNSGSGAFSIQVANGSQNGYLSSTDWTKFNNNIPAGTPATGDYIFYNGSNLAYRGFIATAPLSYNSSTATFSISQASGSTNGYLSSTDWTTFNNKQSALTNPVTGTGTTNYLPKFTGTSTIGNSLVFDNGTNVGIGTATPNELLSLNATGNVNIHLTNATSGTTTNDGFKIGFNTSLNAYLLNKEAGSILFYTTDTLRATLDASGNLGLGVTPSAWASTYKSYQLPVVSIYGRTDDNDRGGITSNAVFGASGFTYVNNGFATLYEFQNGDHRWYNAPSGTAGNAISFTQAMTLNASGNLSVGNTNDTYKLDVSGTGRFTGALTGTSATFSSTVKATQFQLSAASGQYYYFDNASGNNFLGLTATNTLGLYVGGNLSLSIASTGAATFSSSVTAGGDVTSRTSLNAYTLSNVEPYVFLARNSGSNGIGVIRTLDGGALAFDNGATGASQSTKMTITNSGSVGIGTTSPNNIFTIYAASSAIYTQWVQSGTGTSSTDGLRIGLDASSNGIINLNEGTALITSIDGTERMRITSGGLVGIGTTAPNSLLEVNRTITFSSIDTYAQLVVKTTSGANGKLLNIGVDETNSVSFIQSLNRGTDAMPLSLQRYGGAVLIGTTTEGFLGKLQVAGSVAITGQYNTVLPSSSFSYFDGSGQVVSSSSNASALYLDTTWNTTGNPDGIFLNVTNTASGASSKLLNLKVGSVSQFSVSKAGAIQTTAPSSGSAQPWKLGSYAAGGTGTATGVIYIEINGQIYSIPALQGTP